MLSERAQKCLATVKALPRSLPSEARSIEKVFFYDIHELETVAQRMVGKAESPASLAEIEEKGLSAEAVDSLMVDVLNLRALILAAKYS